MSVSRRSAASCVVLLLHLLRAGGLSAGTAADSAEHGEAPGPPAGRPISGSPPFRFLGSYGLEAFGYEDAARADHLALEQTGRLSLYGPGERWSLHGTVSHLSRFDDDFSGEGRGRLLKGFLRHGGLRSRTDVRAGRFFLHRGVMVGVFDGVDLLLRSRRLRVGLFAGLAGPRSREFELEEPDEAFSVGAELRYAPRRRFFSAVHDIDLTYVRQRREEGVTRHLVGVGTRSRWGRSLTLLNVAHFRPRGDLLRKVVSRARYRSADWGVLAEVGALKPSRNEYTWFSEFDVPSSHRVRAGLDRYLGAGGWAAGFDGVVLEAGGETGFRGGPALTSPWGRIGYRFSGGGHSRVAGPWASLRATPGRGFTVHAYGSVMSTEWDAFELDSGDIVTVRVGTRYTPPHYPALTVHGEFQVYRTPQFDQDRRARAGVTWRFDSAGASR
jgi:hypothetical protein